MKVTHITDIDKFFEVIDSCKGRVELVTGEGDRLNLNQRLIRGTIFRDVSFSHPCLNLDAKQNTNVCFTKWI